MPDYQLPVTEPVLEAVIRWPHRRGGEARALGRLYLMPGSGTTQSVVAVLSEIRDNPDHLGLSGDFAAAADAFLALARTTTDPVDPAEIAWVAHHGPFSYYEPVGDETLTAADLAWDGRHYHDDLARHRLLSPAETITRLSGLAMDPVPQVLRRLGSA